MWHEEGVEKRMDGSVFCWFDHIEGLEKARLIKGYMRGNVKEVDSVNGDWFDD